MELETLLPLILALVEEVIKIEPQVQTDLENLFAKKDATPADWQALRAKWAADTYGSHVPDSSIPPGQ